MKIGFIIPTEMENIGVPNDINKASYGPGKAGGCTAAADLIFRQGCDVVVLWGLAGGLAPDAQIGDFYVVTESAYRDFDYSGLLNCKLGCVPGYVDDSAFTKVEPRLVKALKDSMTACFPQKNVKTGSICTGDQIVHHSSRDDYNRIEKVADLVDMEFAAIQQFCVMLKQRGVNVDVCCVRAVSDNADHAVSTSINEFLDEFHRMNASLPTLAKELDMRIK